MRLYKLRRCLAIFFASLILFLTPVGDYLDTQHIQKVEATGVGAAAAGIMSVVPGGQAVVIGLLAGMGIGIAWQNRDKIAETAKGIYDDIKEKFSSWAEEEAQEMVDSGEAETLEEAIIQTESYQSIRDLETLDEEYPAGTVETGDTVVISNANDRVSRLSRHLYRYAENTYGYNGIDKTVGYVNSSWEWTGYSISAVDYLNTLLGKGCYVATFKDSDVLNQFRYWDISSYVSDPSWHFFYYPGSLPFSKNLFAAKFVNGLCTSVVNFPGKYLSLNGDGEWYSWTAANGSSFSLAIDVSPLYNPSGIEIRELSESFSNNWTLSEFLAHSKPFTGKTTMVSLPDNIIYDTGSFLTTAPYQNVGSISLQNSDIYSVAEQAAADALAGNPNLTESELNAIRVQAYADALDVSITDAPVIDVPGTGGNTGENDDEINNIPYVPPVGLPEGVEIGDAAQQLIDQSVSNTNGIIGGLQSLLDALLNLPGKIAQAFVSLFSTLFGWLSNILSTIRTGFADVGEWIMDIPQTLDEQFADVQEWIMDIPITLEQGFSDVLEWIMDIPVTLESQFANVQGWIMDIPIPDTAEITQPIIDTIDDAISVDTDVVQETIAAEQTEVWNLPFFGQAQSLFDSFHFSDTVYYPKIKITTPDIIRPYYKQPEIILLDFEDYKDYCLWARLLCRAILWFALIWHIVDLATPKLRIT